jgi:tryptophan-rich sensory protein
MKLMNEPHSTTFFKQGLWWRVLVSVLVISTLGFLSGYLTQTGVTSWYRELNKPFFNPPNWVFGPAWTLLYILMGFSFGRIWQVAARSRYPIISIYAKKGLGLFALHFILNLAWTPVFFAWQKPGFAIFIILTMLFLIGWLIKHFFRLDRVASFLLVPYFGWVAFASILNISIYWLN